MSPRLLVPLLALGVLVPGLSHAARFDFIYADQVTMLAPLDGWSISLGSNSFGLIVNRGTSSLSVEELEAADFHVDGVPEWPDTTTIPINPAMYAFLVNAHVAGPILPNEAVGGVGTLGAVLLPLIGAGETFRDVWPGSFTWYQLSGVGNSSETVHFDVYLRIGDEAVSFPIFVTLIDSPSYSIEFAHASRVSSSPVVTPLQTTTWGMVKGRYRQ
jgi:hypothetical protein